MTEDAVTVLTQALAMNGQQQRALMRRYDGRSGPRHPRLTDRQRAFAQNYVVHLNANQAARDVKGVAPAARYNPQVAEYIEVLMEAREDGTRLKAEFVREYIYTIMTFCPGDYFRPGPDGQWMIDETAYALLPQTVRMLVETMTLIEFQGTRFMTVTFISKTAALAMAARYTLTQKIDAQVTNVPWDQIAKAYENVAQDTIERKLETLDKELNGYTNGRP